MSEQKIEEGACGAPVGSQVDVSVALQFDRAQQLKAKEEADRKAAQDKLDQAQEIVRELGGKNEQEKKVETLYFVQKRPNGDQCALAGKAKAKIRSCLDHVYGEPEEVCDFVMGEVPEGAYADVNEHALHDEALTLAAQIEEARLAVESATQGNETEVPQLESELHATINVALDQLEHDNDNHWTDAGLPAMNAIEAMVGDEKVNRSDVEAARPGFVRIKPSAEPVEGEGVSLG